MCVWEGVGERGVSLQLFWTQSLNHSEFCQEPPKTCCRVSKIHCLLVVRGHCAELWSGGFFVIVVILFYFFLGLESREFTHVQQITCTRRKNTWSSHGSNMIMVKCPPLFFNFTYSRKWATDHKGKEKKQSSKKSHFYRFLSTIHGLGGEAQTMHFREGGARYFCHADMQWCP